MRNNPLPGLCKKSPIKQEINTTWADKVFSGEKVNRTLREKGLHTDPKVGRGKINTSTGDTNAGSNNAMIDMSV